MYKQFNSNRNNKRRFTHNIKNAGVEVVRAIRALQFTNKPDNIALDDVYAPKHKFEEFPIFEQLKRNILSKNYTVPTPIQDQAIPAILAGQDVIGIANTGTGKTAAFLIPLIDKVFKNKAEKVLIITPTRELALQINDEFIVGFDRAKIVKLLKINE